MSTLLCYTPGVQSSRAALADLIGEIERQEQAGRSWRLTPAHLQRILGLSREHYYQEIYGAQVAGHPLIDLSLALEPFSQASAPSLLAVLEHLCGAAAETALERAGVFFSHDQQAEIMAEFLTGAAAAVREHRFQDQEFAAMLRTFGRFPEARRVYLDHFSRCGLRNDGGITCWPELPGGVSWHTSEDALWVYGEDVDDPPPW